MRSANFLSKRFYKSVFIDHWNTLHEKLVKKFVNIEIIISRYFIVDAAMT